MSTRASGPTGGLKGDIAAAVALAAVLGVGWTIRDWPALSTLRLPDTDDVMRLQQVRDWLGGQRWSDLTQHRLGAAGSGGVPMHWSRLADLGPAALIEGAMPLAGRHAAELAAVIVWPIALFALALTLVARIARTVAGPGPARTAVVVAAVAYPATTIFLPGRIDHHGLQLALLLGALLATIGAPTLRRGLAAGGCAAASLVVGLETAPLLGVLGAAAAACWASGETGAERRLVGWAVGALAGLAIGRVVFAPDAFAYPACDGFTLDAWRAAAVAGAGALVLGAVGLARPPVPLRLRWIATILVGGGAAVAAVAVSPRCLAPYGAVDPLLVRLWLSHVGEAQSLVAAPIATAIGYAGVMLAGLVATLWRVRTAPSRAWATLLAVQVATLLVTAMQLRGAYAGAMLGAPALAAAIVAARARSALALAGTWLASAGMLYPIAAAAGTRASGGAADTGCSAPAVIARLAVLPPGTLLAPIDTGAWAIAATRLRLVSAPYHRDNAGNLAAYRFFLGPSGDAGRPLVDAWNVRYVLACDGDLSAMGAGTATMARRLATAHQPRWLMPLPAPAGAHLYAVRR
ncbi:hypothetical protein [uncultured Sphingomonas sp.]|uniref:hypothetical protein n=1 Tax=uncultured Sphingomonas sp. TaxID=158754 RepID=UPI0035CB8384